MRKREERLSEKQLKQLVPFMASLFVLAGTSNSKRRACGAGFVRWRNGIPTFTSTGINGTPVGSCNVCENEDLTLTLPHVVHAEINALNSRVVPVQKSYILLVTDSPCEFCLQELAKHDLRHIVYCRPYRLQSHLSKFDFHYYELSEKAVDAHLQKSIGRMDQIIC